jgi:hypothetical protein
MLNKAVHTRMQVRSIGRLYQKETSQSGETFPLEVINLLNVCARIEARRQARLHGEQKEVG